MAEGTYEYECMRAELLGLARPSREQFEEQQKLKQEVEEEEQLTEQLKVCTHTHAHTYPSTIC